MKRSKFSEEQIAYALCQAYALKPAQRLRFLEAIAASSPLSSGIARSRTTISGHKACSRSKTAFTPSRTR